MSFVNLTTQAVHKRHEMEERIHMFLTKCDNTIRNLEYLKKQAQGLITQLNCDHTDLKDRFLSCIKTLEEYSYLISDINLAVEHIIAPAKPATPPFYDMKKRVPQLNTSISPFNIIHTEPTLSTSKPCHLQDKSKRKHTNNQLLISFSTESVNESIPSPTKQPFLPIIEGVKNIKIEEDEIVDCVKLPAQTVLQLDSQYPAVLLHVDGTSFWVTTDNIDEAFQLMTDMTEFYKQNKATLSLDQFMPPMYCAVYEESDSYTRGLYLQISEDINYAQVHLVDYGETRLVPTCWLQQLMPQFCNMPPFARYCHLAGVDINCEDALVVEKVEEILKMYLGRNCTIYVDDNGSESLGVYIVMESGEKLNDIVLNAIFPDKTNNIRPESLNGFPGLNEENCDITQIPEYDDPVLAVTGYHNRDEADICKHYKGGPKKTCFKGTRCTKRHVVKHPDGWTLDRVSVPAKLRSLPLPAAGNFVRVVVTHVPHFDRFYVQLIDSPKDSVFQTQTLSDLLKDMNCADTISSYEQLKMIPAPGELVAALYPMDGKWYRAKVLTSTKADQKVEIKYVDYGNLIWVEEELLRELEPRFCVLPTQAILCHLAGVTLRNQTAAALTAGRNALTSLIQDNIFDAEVIATDYDSITVALCDGVGNNIADLLASQKVVELQEYTIDYKLTDAKRHVLIAP